MLQKARLRSSQSCAVSCGMVLATSWKSANHVSGKHKMSFPSVGSPPNSHQQDYYIFCSWSMLIPVILHFVLESRCPCDSDGSRPPQAARTDGNVRQSAVVTLGWHGVMAMSCSAFEAGPGTFSNTESLRKWRSTLHRIQAKHNAKNKTLFKSNSIFI